MSKIYTPEEAKEYAISQPKHVGQPIQRKEDFRLLTGNGQYVADIKLDRMVHVAFLRSDHSHALINSIAVEAASEVPGVLGIYTAHDLKGIEPLHAPSKTKGYQSTPNPALAKEKVRYVGEPVVAVVAKNRYVAEDALELIEVDYEPLETVIDPEQAVKADAAYLHDDIGSNVVLERTFKTGEAEEKIETAPHCVKGTFRFHRKSPSAMETRSYVADYSKSKDKLTLHYATQIPGIVKDVLAELLGLAGNKIRVIAPDVGGGFGGKGSVYGEEIVVAYLAKELKRPVKWISDRLEDLSSTSQGFDEVVDAALSFDSDGNFLSLLGDVIGDIGAYSIYPWTAALEPVQVISFLPGPYKIPNYKGRVRCVTTSKPPMGPYRGVGRPTSTFVLERLIDMAAKQLGMDPYEIRMKNLVQMEEFPFRIGSGIIWDRSEFVGCLETACEKAEYRQLRQLQDDAKKEGRCLGLGLASYAELTGIGSRISVAPGMPINTGSETVKVQIDASGAVTATFGVCAQGQSIETTFSQIVADELGLTPDDIEVVYGDTENSPQSTGTYASRNAVIAGGAAIISSKNLRKKINKIAAFLLQVDEEQVECVDGVLKASNSSQSVTLKQVAKYVYSDMSTLPVDMRVRLEETETYDPVVGTTAAATHLALVEVDPQTYAIKILKYVVAEDCGRMINPLVVNGQVHGGVAQGVGAALLEELVYDDNGQLLTASLADYLLPTAVEVPHIEVEHLESELPENPGGFRGMGEGGTIGAPAAIANAISDALSHLDINIQSLPVTSEKLFQMINGE